MAGRDSEFGGKGVDADAWDMMDEAGRTHRGVIQTDPNSMDAPGQTAIADQRRNERT